MTQLRIQVRRFFYRNPARLFITNVALGQHPAGKLYCSVSQVGPEETHQAAHLVDMLFLGKAFTAVRIGCDFAEPVLANSHWRQCDEDFVIAKLGILLCGTGLPVIVSPQEFGS
jgi:hypothetical protein